MGNVILMILMITLSFLAGIWTVLKHISKIDKNYTFASKGSSFDKIKDNLKYLGLDNILDCCHAYGYNNGWEDRQKVYDEEIDTMLMELSGETKN